MAYVTCTASLIVLGYCLTLILSSFHLSSSPLVHHISQLSIRIRIERHESKDTRAESEMASHARYERAPQRDSLEEAPDAWAQHPPPPSYQATTTPTTTTPEFAEGPRSEGDNVPDDFKVSFSSLIVCLGFLALERGW